MSATLKRQQPAKQPTARDLNRVQDNVATLATAMQKNALEFVANAPESSTSPGKRGQAYYGENGILYLCVSPDSWVQFQGVTF